MHDRSEGAMLSTSGVRSMHPTDGENNFKRAATCLSNAPFNSVELFWFACVSLFMLNGKE